MTKNCKLCGKLITKVKGMSQKMHEYQIMASTHIMCAQNYEAITRQYQVSDHEYLAAIADGLLALFPELKETKSMKQYYEQVKKLETVLKERFPLLENKQ